MKNKDFDLGVIVSASIIINSFDEPAMAKEILDSAGITKNRIKTIADDYDKKALLKLFEEE